MTLCRSLGGRGGSWLGLGSLIMLLMCSYDVNKLKFQIWKRSDLFELSYDEILNYPENLSSIRLVWVLGWFWVFDPFLAKNRFLAQGGSKFSAPTLIICWAWTTLKFWAQLDLWLRLWILSAVRVLVRVLVPGVIIQKTSAKSDLTSWLGHGWTGLGWAWLGFGWGLSIGGSWLGLVFFITFWMCSYEDNKLKFKFL